MTTQTEMEQAIEGNIKHLSIMLADSPISFAVTKASELGVYRGYCAGKGWEVNHAWYAKVDSINIVGIIDSPETFFEREQKDTGLVDAENKKIYVGDVITIPNPTPTQH